MIVIFVFISTSTTLYINNMESCILLPKQLSLVSCLNPDLTNILEMDVAVWSNCYLSTGTSLPVDDGEIKYEKLEVFSKLKSDNIRHQFGCYDEILTVENREVRHCNWVRFVKSSSKLEEVNVIGVKLKGEVVYQMVKDVKPNEEIVVYFQNLPETIPVKEEKELLKENKTTDDVKTVSSYSTTLGNDKDDSIVTTTTSDDSGIFSDSPRNRSASPVAVLTNTAIKRSRGRRWLPCEVCHKKFDRPSLLTRHMRTHTGEKPHVCETCDKAFSTSSSLNTHRRIHSGEKPHVCNICGKKFTASSNLYYHRMTHNKEKPHKCTTCSKSFPTPGDLKSHMYVHSGSWPFTCDVCNRGFSKQTNLKNHMLLHSGEKPYGCGSCDKKFTLFSNLKSHLKTHEGHTNMSAVNTSVHINDVRLASGTANHQSSPDFTTSKSPSDFSITRLTDNNSKRRRLDVNNSYSPSVFNNENKPLFPVYCSTPLDTKHSPFSLSPFPMMSPLAQSNHFLSAMMVPSNKSLHRPTGSLFRR